MPGKKIKKGSRNPSSSVPKCVMIKYLCIFNKSVAEGEHSDGTENHLEKHSEHAKLPSRRILEHVPNKYVILMQVQLGVFIFIPNFYISCFTIYFPHSTKENPGVRERANIDPVSTNASSSGEKFPCMSRSLNILVSSGMKCN